MKNTCYAQIVRNARDELEYVRTPHPRGAGRVRSYREAAVTAAVSGVSRYGAQKVLDAVMAEIPELSFAEIDHSRGSLARNKFLGKYVRDPAPDADRRAAYALYCAMRR